MASPLLLAMMLPPTLFFFSTIWNLFNNYLLARKVGLPIVIVPISPTNPVWMLIGRYFLPLIQHIPFGNGYFTRFCHIGWEFDEKNRAHLELGDAFIFATPGKNWIYLCNADTTEDIIRRERQGEFARPVEVLASLEVFGPNISIVGLVCQHMLYTGLMSTRR
jgi:hypothetical protein